MSCSVCRGHDSRNCPCCGGSSVCPECGGTGKAFTAYDMEKDAIIKVSEDEYRMLPEDEDEANELGVRYYREDIIDCEMCDGEGYMI